MPRRRDAASSEIDRDGAIQLPASKIVGHRIPYIVHVGNPIIAAYVRYAEQIKHLEANPHVADSAIRARGRPQRIVESDVDALVGRSAEIALVARGMRRRYGQSVAQHAAQAEFEARQSGKIVSKIEPDAIPTVVGARHVNAIELFVRLHQREAQP